MVVRRRDAVITLFATTRDGNAVVTRTTRLKHLFEVIVVFQVSIVGFTIVVVDVLNGVARSPPLLVGQANDRTILVVVKWLTRRSTDDVVVRIGQPRVLISLMYVTRIQKLIGRVTT